MLNRMLKGTLYIGIGKTAGGQSIPPDDAKAGLERLSGLASSWFGGYTLNHGEGGWMDDGGRFVREPSVQFTVIVEPERRYLVGDLAMIAKEEFRQAEVWATTEEVVLLKV